MKCPQVCDFQVPAEGLPADRSGDRVVGTSRSQEIRSITIALDALARLFTWGSAISREPRAVGKRARNRVIMRGVGRALRK